MATNYAINYEDERFKNVENKEQQELNQLNDTYNNMINQSDQFYQRQIDAVRDYNTTQQDLQNQQTDLAINEINQAKEKSEQDYLKEQRGAYSDYQKESNRYGANAEQMASNGLRNTGYSESSQVSMYNTYQNRVATARQSYNLAIQNYDNKIAEARLANNSRLAEIAYNSLQQELELSLNGFQYKNTLLLNQIQQQQNISDRYYTRWQNVLSQMNTENALAESIRQYNANMKYQKQRDKVKDKQWKMEYNLSKKASSSSGRSYSSSGGRTSKSGSTTGNLTNNNSKVDNKKKTTATDEVTKKLSKAAKNTKLTAIDKNKLINQYNKKYKTMDDVKKNINTIYKELDDYVKKGQLSQKDAQNILMAIQLN